MKSRPAKLTIITILALIGTLGNAHAETLLGDVIYENGISIGGDMIVTQVDGNAVKMSGFQLHWVINRNFKIGLYNYDTITEEHHTFGANTLDYQMELSGIDIGYTVNPDDLLHWGGSLTFGGGHIEFESTNSAGITGNPDDDFFFVQPMLHSELNLIDDFKVGASAGYRFTSGVNTIDLLNKDMNGYVVALTLKFVI